MSWLAKDNVAPNQQSLAGWMSERIGKWSVGSGCRHAMTLHEASFKTLLMTRQVCSTQLLSRPYIEKTACNILASAPHSEPNTP